MRIFEIDKPTPTVAYHITTEDNAIDILQDGLDPRNDAHLDWYTEGKRAYLIVDTKDIYQVRGWMDAKLEHSHAQESPLTLLKIDVSGLSLNYEGGWYYSTVKIPANRIVDLGEEVLNRYS